MGKRDIHMFQRPKRSPMVDHLARSLDGIFGSRVQGKSIAMVGGVGGSRRSHL